MALYYYINISLSRINLKKISGGKRDVYYCIYTRTYYITIGQKEKEREMYITVYSKKILLGKLKYRDILYSYIYRGNTD